MRARGVLLQVHVGVAERLDVLKKRLEVFELHGWEAPAEAGATDGRRVE
jgi:hypothetical protein